MLYALILLAEGEAPQQGPGGGGLGLMLPYLLMIGVLFYFLMIRPQNKDRERLRQMIAALKKNDKVLNSGGIIGIVDSIREKEDEIILKGGVHITKTSIVRIMNADETAKENEK